MKQRGSECPGANSRGLAILGSTGSIGRQALDVVERHPDRLRVVSLAGGSNFELLAEQAERYRPRYVAIGDQKVEQKLRARLAHLECVIGAGPTSIVEAASVPDAGLVLAGMVGAAGLLPTLAAIDAGKDVAIANKEVLVAAGAIITAHARRSGALILPVDSEHSAIFQCIHGQQKHAIRRLILTASGGPFARLDAESLCAVTPADALKHPTWQMGAKITVDCATLMNKGLEVIEARWLFDLPPSQIDIIIHHQSIVHSLVEYADGSVLAQLGWPSMILPIQYALLYPDRASTKTAPLDLAQVATLTFAKPDFHKFPALRLAREALEQGQNYPAALSAANEEAVAAFLAGAVRFTEIPSAVGHALERHAATDENDLDSVLAADIAARAAAREWIRSSGTSH